MLKTPFMRKPPTLVVAYTLAGTVPGRNPSMVGL
jgi:hypothetical protein